VKKEVSWQVGRFEGRTNFREAFWKREGEKRRGEGRGRTEGIR